jgi:hypothetical protein
MMLVPLGRCSEWLLCLPHKDENYQKSQHRQYELIFIITQTLETPYCYEKQIEANRFASLNMSRERWKETTSIVADLVEKLCSRKERLRAMEVYTTQLTSTHFKT